MNSLVIEKTDSTPGITFNKDGELSVVGRSLPEDVHKFYDPLIDWVKNSDSKNIKLDLKLEYLNTSSTKKVLNLLIALEENKNIENIDINWYYESDDLEMEELGSIYEEELTRAKFHYREEVDIF